MFTKIAISYQYSVYLIQNNVSIETIYFASTYIWSWEGGRNNGACIRRLTGVLRGHLIGNMPMGVKFMEGIGGLWGLGSTSHWINIVRISYSWHQDTSQCLGEDTRRCCWVSQERTVTTGAARVQTTHARGPPPHGADCLLDPCLGQGVRGEAKVHCGLRDCHFFAMWMSCTRPRV